MACDITQGRLKVCKNSLGGNTSLYLFNYVADPFTIVDGEATAINALLTEAFKYELEGDSNTLVEDMVTDRNTGTTVNTQTLNVVLKKIDANTSAEMNLLAKGYPMAVVQDRNGNYSAIGIDDGIDFNVNSSSGGAKTDLNGFTLVGTSTVGSLSPKLDSATITAFLALVAPTISGATTVAVGASIMLIGSGLPAAASTWVSGTPAKATVVDNNTNSVWVTGVEAGTTIITYTDLSGQTATTTITVT